MIAPGCFFIMIVPILSSCFDKISGLPSISPRARQEKAKKHLQEGPLSPFLRVLPSQVPLFVIVVNDMEEGEICQGE
ncbi:hypothetical protein [Paenibacillus dendritiformis]|uniref:hypothetical protein n=1 Tax=Paenibacillus dendritiformis TaxID=130049 RepID=UPI00387E1C85